MKTVFLYPELYKEGDLGVLFSRKIMLTLNNCLVLVVGAVRSNQGQECGKALHFGEMSVTQMFAHTQCENKPLANQLQDINPRVSKSRPSLTGYRASGEVCALNEHPETKGPTIPYVTSKFWLKLTRSKIKTSESTFL